MVEIIALKKKQQHFFLLNLLKVIFWGMDMGTPMTIK